MNDHPGSERSSLDDAAIEGITIGGAQPLNGPVVLVPYDPEWPDRFLRLATEIRTALGDRACLIEHVGSTSVAGLCAKPIIDVVLGVADSAAEEDYVPDLEAAGYVLKIREPDWFQHRLLKAPGIDANVHVFSLGCTEIERMLLFRDHLRAHARDRALYEGTKRRLAAQTWRYTQNYADAKSDVVRAILARARAEPAPGVVRVKGDQHMVKQDNTAG